MFNKLIFSIFFLFFLVIQNVLGVQFINSFFNESDQGYFYYKNPPKPHKDNNKTKKPKISKTIQVITKNPHQTLTNMEIKFPTPTQIIQREKLEKKYMNNIPWGELNNLSTDEYKRLLNTVRNIALENPNKQYVKDYMALQKFWIDKSATFAKVWHVDLMENPNKLAYTAFQFSNSGRFMKSKQRQAYSKAFFNAIKNRLGYIVIIPSKEDTAIYNHEKQIYRMVKSATGLDYIIVGYSSVPKIVRRLHITEQELPANIMMYNGSHGQVVYRRVVTGYSSVSAIVYNTKFMFQNAIPDDEKRPEDRHYKFSN